MSTEKPEKRTRSKPKHRPIRSAITIAKLLDCEGFTDHTANQLDKFARQTMTERQLSSAKRYENAMSDFCRPLSAADRLLIGKFVSLHKKMAFMAGLRMGLTAHAVKQDKACEFPERLSDQSTDEQW